MPDVCKLQDVYYDQEKNCRGWYTVGGGRVVGVEKEGSPLRIKRFFEAFRVE